jgi:Skp family chaperone for outer membrane proteins
MKKTLRKIAFIICIFYSNIVFSNETIYYIDMDFIMNNSLAGKSIIKQLETKNKSYADKFKKNEADLALEEKKLISQKNILDKKEFDEKVNLFNQKVLEYRKKRKESLNIFAKLRNDAQKTLVEKLTPILGDYSKNNSISIILPKKNVIIAKSELDLTKNIILILNKKIKAIKLK